MTEELEQITTKYQGIWFIRTKDNVIYIGQQYKSKGKRFGEYLLAKPIIIDIELINQKQDKFSLIDKLFDENGQFNPSEIKNFYERNSLNVSPNERINCTPEFKKNIAYDYVCKDTEQKK